MLRYRRNAKGRTQKGTTKWHDDNTKPYDGGKPLALAALPASRAPRSETCSTYACLGASAASHKYYGMGTKVCLDCHELAQFSLQVRGRGGACALTGRPV